MTMLRLRQISRNVYLPTPTVKFRSLVSHLMNRSYENDTLAQLKLEAKERGLSQTGNKATLITKLQDHDKSEAFKEMQAPVSPLQSRSASTTATPTPIPTTSVPHLVTKTLESAKPAPGSVVPGIPPESQADAKLVKTPLTHLYIPDISQPLPEAPAQVPYLPDFWDSTKTRKAPSGELDTTGLAPESSQPKMVVVAGATTHHGGGPSHNAHTGPESTERHSDHLPTSVVAVENTTSRILEIIGMPSIGLPEATASPQKLEVRELHDDEKTGLYWILGGTVTAWISENDPIINLHDITLDYKYFHARYVQHIPLPFAMKRILFLQRNIHTSSVRLQMLVGPSDPVSHLRPVIYVGAAKRVNTREHPYSLDEFDSKGPPTLELWEKRHLEQTDKFNHDYWTESNTRFNAAKHAVLSSLPTTCSTLDREAAMSEFYKSWLVQEADRQRAYDAEWRKLNQESILLAIRKEWQKFKASLGFGEA